MKLVSRKTNRWSRHLCRALTSSWLAGATWIALAAIALHGTAVAAQADDAEDAKPKTISVAVLVFPGVELLDFAGPAEVFAGARDGENDPLFEVYTVAASKEPLKSLRFLSITPQHDPTDAPRPDILVIPGGSVEFVMNNPELLEWIKRQRDDKCLLFSVCNGASVLAKLGYLDGLQVATHHDNIPLLELLAPKAKCLKDRKFVDNGNVVTAAGISSGIDGALYVVSRLKGADAARRVATYVEYDHYAGFDRPGSEQPEKDAQGIVSQKGRVHENKPWAIVSLIALIREKGEAAALQAYPQLMKDATGADRQMIEAPGISMSAHWLMKHGRDHEIPHALLTFNVAANPKSPLAHIDLGKQLLEGGNKVAAKACFEQALQIAPDNQKARELLEACR